MHTLVKLVALSVAKYYMALTEIQLKLCRFHGSLSQKSSRPLSYIIFSLAHCKSLILFAYFHFYLLRKSL